MKLNKMRKMVLSAYEFYYENTIDVFGGSDIGEIVIEEQTELLNSTLDEIEESFNHRFSVSIHQYLAMKAKYNVQTYM